MRKIYYKVIDNKISRKSIIMSMGKDESLIVTYSLNQWVKPILKGSKLFVFSNLNDAKCFQEAQWVFSGFKAEIIKCYVKNPSRSESLPTKFLSSIHSSRLEEIQELWDGYGKIKKNHKKMKLLWDQLLVKTAPIGTVFCDEVYCLE